MIAALIRWSIANRFLVLMATVLVTAWGVYAVLRTPLDAIPDLSDVQVIIRTTWPGQAPRIVEDQVTYPLTTTMLSVPGAKTVRGYSFFGDSFVYILFADGTDPYWARSRVLEYLNQVQARLPAQAKPALGPDATGVGWIYQYALVDRSGRLDLGAAARAAGLVPQVRAEGAAQRRRGRDRRRHGAAVPGRARPGSPARLRDPALEGDRGDPEREPRDRRLGARAGRGRVHGARERLPEDARRLPRDPASGRQGRGAGDARRRRARADGPGDAARHRRARRRGRGRRRRDRHARRQERARDDRRGEGAARRAREEPAAGRRDRRDLRPLGADRARGAAPARQARRGVRRRRARLRRSSCCTCARRSSPSSRCRSACWSRSS